MMYKIFPMDGAEIPELNLEASFIYAIEGSTIFILNIFLAIFIIFDKSLRSEKISIIYLAHILYDSFVTLGYVSAGVYRLNLYYNECGHCTTYYFTPWVCFNTIHAYLWIIFTPATGIIALVSSLERLLSVTYPLYHRVVTRKWTAFIVFIPFLVSIPFLVISGIESYGYRDNYQVTVACNIINGDMPGIMYHLRSIRLGSSVLAILFYIPILAKIYALILNKSTTKLTPTEQKKLIRSTLTVGLFAANELCFFVFPDTVLYISPKDRYVYIFYVILLNKGVGNMIFLIITQKELKKALKRNLKKIFMAFTTSSSAVAP